MISPAWKRLSDYSNNLNDIYAGDDRIVICGSEGLILSGDFDFNFQKIEGTSSSVDWLAIDGSNEGYVLCEYTWRAWPILTMV